MGKAVLFDLDDTLTDQQASVASYARRFHVDFGGDLEPVDVGRILAVIKNSDGNGYAPRQNVFAALQRELSWLRVPDLTLLAAHWDACYPAETSGRDSLLSTLENLSAQGFRLGIVTNGRVKIQEAKINRLGIRPLLASVVISEAVGFEKPEAGIFERALNDLACSRFDVWYVGDHPEDDIIGAAAAGLKSVWLRGSHPWPSSVPLPRYRIDKLIDIGAVILDEVAPSSP